MKGKIIGLAFGAATMLVIAAPAFAASISDARFSNNDVTVDAAGNSTISGTYTLTVNMNEAIEWQRVTVNGITTDMSVGDNLGKQEGVYHNMPFTAKVPPNTGTYNVDLSGDGIYGANRAISPVDGGANSWMGPTTVGTVRVVAGGSSSDTVGNDGAPSWLATLLAAIAGLKPVTPTPTVSPACTTLSMKMAGTMQGAVSPANIKLQGYLLSEGASIPALAAGAAFGFYGPQTMSAVSWFKSVNNCQ